MTDLRSADAPSSVALPVWLREFDASLSIHPHVALWGNVRDYYVLPDGEGFRFATMTDALWSRLSALGFTAMLITDPIDGLSVFPGDEETRQRVASFLGGGGSRGSDLLASIRAVAACRDMRIAILVDYASRLIHNPSQIEEAEHAFFSACEKLSHTTVPLTADDGVTLLYNPVIWLLNGERDLPAFYAIGSESVRMIGVPMPDVDQLRCAADRLVSRIAEGRALSEDGAREAARNFAAQSTGLSIRSMIAITRLAARFGNEPKDLDEASRCYRVGVTDDPWSKHETLRAIASAPDLLSRRVLGQDAAIRRACDILMRSATGLTAAHAPSAMTRPRGILFLAGPTGVGKTELAKGLSELIFGSAQAYVRFDMSEFSAEHAADRLIGAPPGYVGYNAGGELTNAMRNRPFSLVLFDEIEKANRLILDKFLQVLDDGRLTDGRGDTVYFSESIIVFTSNLGIVEEDEKGNQVWAVDPESPPDVVERSVRAAMARRLRPEMINRLGDSIVVFSFISREVGEQIFDLQVGHVTRRLASEHDVRLVLSDTARTTLLEAALADLRNGARGIGTTVESVLVNPLARLLFEDAVASPAGQREGRTLEILDLQRDQSNVSLSAEWR